MANKKVTLSINAEVYSSFQKFCEDNAIMLSKKIELVMKDFIEEWKILKIKLNKEKK